MSTQLDSSIGLVKEPAYGTVTTPTHFPEYLTENLDWKPAFMQGHGFRQGSRTPRNERRALGKNYVDGDIEVECVAKGIGIFFEALLGTSASTALTAPAFQQNFTVATSDPINSYTVQKGLPPVGGGAVLQHTFSGMVCTKGDLTSAQGDVVKLKTSWNGQKVDTTTAYTAPSYIASNELFTFTEGAITYGGTVTAPTATTLASGGTSAADIVDFSLSIDNKPNVDGYTYGGGGKQSRKPVLGELAATGKLTAEFDAITLRDAFLNQTPLNIVLTFTSTTQLATGIFNTLQVYLPTVKLGGTIPPSTNGVIRQAIPFEVLDGGSGVSPITVCLRTLDTAV